MTTTTITLAVPTPFAIDPARLVAWLTGRGWAMHPHRRDAEFSIYHKGCQAVVVVIDQTLADTERRTIETIHTLADAEGMEPAALAALLAAPVEGPALQWAMMSERARAEVIARIADLASTDRQSVAILRADGCADQALEAEGDALGLEAAAAVLRVGGRG